MNGVTPYSCLGNFVKLVSQHPKRSISLYAIIMAIFIGVMVTNPIPIETRSIVAFAVGAAHLTFIFMSCSFYEEYRNQKADAEHVRRMQRIDEEHTEYANFNTHIDSKNRADRQMIEVMGEVDGHPKCPSCAP